MTNCYDYSVVRDATNGNLDDYLTVGGALQTDNCYYTAEQCAEQQGLTGVTEEQIKNGALCYMLNQGNTKRAGLVSDDRGRPVSCNGSRRACNCIWKTGQ